MCGGRLGGAGMLGSWAGTLQGSLNEGKKNEMESEPTRPRENSQFLMPLKGIYQELYSGRPWAASLGLVQRYRNLNRNSVPRRRFHQCRRRPRQVHSNLDYHLHCCLGPKVVLIGRLTASRPARLKTRLFLRALHFPHCPLFWRKTSHSR